MSTIREESVEDETKLSVSTNTPTRTPSKTHIVSPGPGKGNYFCFFSLTNERFLSLIKYFINSDAALKYGDLVPILNKPVTIHGHTNLYLSNIGAERGFFHSDSRHLSSQWVIIPSPFDASFTLKSLKDGKNLQAQPHDPMRNLSVNPAGQFRIEKSDDKYFFIIKNNPSKVLQCTLQGVPSLSNVKGKSEALCIEPVIPDPGAIKVTAKW